MNEKMTNQLRSVIQWEDPDPSALFERWTERGDEIKNASKLIVGPGQGCLFVLEGKVEALFEEEGVYDLKTGNVPFWTTVKKVMYNFESSHKVGIYYYRKAEMLNIRWGTPSPINYKDPVYNFPVGLGAFGNFSFKITEPMSFFTQVIGAVDYYSVREIQRVILSRITQPISDFLANCSFGYTDIDKHRNEIAAHSRSACEGIFLDLGFSLLDFRIEGTNFDEDTQRRIGRITDMSAEAQALKELGVSYQEYQQLEAMRDITKKDGPQNIGGQMGAGFELGQTLGKMMTGQQNQTPPPQQQAPPQQTPPRQNPPQQASSEEDEMMLKLGKLKKMFEAGLIDEDEYKAKKQEILANI